MAVVCSESRFMNISLVNTDLVKPCNKIQFSEISGTIKLIKHIVHSWNRKSISNSNRIKSPVICTKSPGAVLLLN
ncbi:hypothetical protein MANES_06G149450v8 [Manihot esculenta]|uniref:Uncharacterized protein n=1 Tax=Manihot esculenta TaxID=3983 RepID=A0ACB7HLS8_MANES|nr:hypothetical protein MANES_06G149450v8 [Manihot esculenta]